MDVSPGSLVVHDPLLNHNFSLVCTGVVTSSIPPQKFHENNIYVLWSNSAGPIQNMENMTATGVSFRNGVFSSTLLFHPFSPGHDRIYTCLMTLDSPYYSTKSNTSQYVVVNGKLLSFYYAKFATYFYLQQMLLIFS